MWWIIPAVIAAFLAVIIVRTIMFKPNEQEGVDTSPTPIDGALAAEHLQKMVQCKTVSYYDKDKMD